ncbi:MAG: flagellar type III secretion system protein FlhB, partial [Kangiellaceae bacterium]|nr:flagellar type III secretion system protein FlhB [Kangiellaceae bacterium]
VADISLQLDRSEIFDVGYMLTALSSSVFGVFKAFTLFFLALFLISALSPVLLGGITISGSAIKPKGDRLSPLKGFKRMFGTTAAMELLKAIAKFSLVAVFAWLVIDSNFGRYMQLGRSTPQAEVVMGIEMLLTAMVMISASLILIALIDVPFQLWNHAKQLKMTKQEVKDEFKETEGKPEVKGKIRQAQRELAHRRMMEAVPEADVVVTNPEHYSVAIKYDQHAAGAPIVVAKGLDEIAMNIRKVANAHDVPLLAAPPLARAIYHTTDLDQEIPADLYLAVAQVLAYVLQLQAFRKGKARRPKAIKDFPIPEYMNY